MKITWGKWKNPTQFKHLAYGQAFIFDRETPKLYMKIRAASEDDINAVTLSGGDGVYFAKDDLVYLIDNISLVIGNEV